MATKRKSTGTTKKDLEAKIAELEAKLSNLSSQAGGTAQKAPPPPKPQQAPPKPAEKKAAPPATLAQALENAWQNAATSNTHSFKEKVTGFSPNPNRYYARRVATIGHAPTQDWNFQKAKVTGYTANSNQYYATRARMAYHPADKMFAGYGLVVEGATAQAKKAPPPPPPPPRTEPQPQQTASSSGGSSKQSNLEAYERDYLARLDAEERAHEELMQAAAELAAKRRTESGGSSGQTHSTKGTLPKGF